MRYENATVEYRLLAFGEGPHGDGHIRATGSQGNLYTGPVEIKEGEAHLEKVGLILSLRMVDAIIVDGKSIDFRN